MANLTIFCIILSCLISISLQNELGISSDPCIYRHKGFFWDIGDLTADDEGITVDGPDGNSVNFNFCKQVVCDGNEGYAKLVNDDGSCSILTDDKNNPSENVINKESLNLTYKYTGDDTCQFDPSKKYMFEIVFKCTDDESNPEWTTSEDNPCKISVQWENDAGCPILKMNAVWNFIRKYHNYVVPAVIAIGAFFVLFGGYFNKISIFLITWVTVIFVAMALIYSFMLSYSTPEWVGWIVLPACAVAGLIAASLLISFLKIGAFLVGAWFGGTLATLLFELFIYKISSKEAVLWGMIIILAIIMGIIALKFLKLVMIVGTSFIGSFLVIKGLSFYFGGYPNEFELYNEIQVGDLDNVPSTFYIYAAGILVLTIFGIIFQYNRCGLCKKGSGKNKGGYEKMSP